MNRRGFTLVEMMLYGAIIVLLAAVAIPALRIWRNERAARVNLLSLSSAAEVYAKTHDAYPTTLDELAAVLSSGPDFCADMSGKGVKSVQGYNYKCASTSTSYTFEAAPVGYGMTASPSYAVTTGGKIASNKEKSAHQVQEGF